MKFSPGTLLFARNVGGIISTTVTPSKFPPCVMLVVKMNRNMVGTDNNITNNLYYHVNIGDVVTPGRQKILMTDCDTSVCGTQLGGVSGERAPLTEPCL